ncbi:hypothetical protein [Tardiphaga sp. 839_C3_N1_4]|uniref:hypothetical protein n=1 Tax=Tardiphaga sp. 839_C3_N1_4 TaxID=3240761 RepID=UPI003F20A5FB
MDDDLEFPVNTVAVQALSDQFFAIRGSVTVSRQHPCIAAFLIVVTSAVSPTAVTAQPLTSFRYETQAQVHCPDDSVVWLDFRKNVYYLKRQKKYGRGTTGSFVCRKEASDSGFRHSLLGVR